MTLSEVASLIKAGNPPSIEIHSFEPSLYLIFLRDGDTLHPIKDARGNTLRYFSRSKALTPLGEAGLKVAEFVHQSPFVEMIGMDGGDRKTTELRQTIHLNNITSI